MITTLDFLVVNIEESQNLDSDGNTRQNCYLDNNGQKIPIYAIDGVLAISTKSPPPLQMSGIEKIEHAVVTPKYDWISKNGKIQIAGIKILHHPSIGYYFTSNASASKLQQGDLLRPHQEYLK